MWYWPGCEIEIRGIRPKFCFSYLDTMKDGVKPGLEKFKTAVNEAIEVFRNGSGDFAGGLIYTAQLKDPFITTEIEPVLIQHLCHELVLE